MTARPKGRGKGPRSAASAIAIGIALCGCVLAQSPGGTRRALLIGEANYPVLTALPTPLGDVRGLASALQKLQFRTTTVENPNLDRIDASLTQFLKEVKAGDAVLFYYSGYAIQQAGEDYLVPVNYDPSQRLNVDYAAYSVTRILSDIRARKPSLTMLILDACREEAALRRRFPQPGLALIESHDPDTLIVFSASAGKYSHESAGRPRSLYTQALIDNLAKPGLSIDQLLEDVRRSVNEESKGAQIPTEISTLAQPFVMNAHAADAEAWERVRDSSDIGTLEDFRSKFPNSAMAAEAARQIERLEWQRVSQTRDLVALRSFVTKYPSGPHAGEARTEVANLTKGAETDASRRLIDEALQRYQTAFENRDIDALKVAWPSLSRAELGSFQNFFRTVRTMKLELTPLADPEIASDTATVRYRRVVTARDERGPLPPQDQTVTIRLRKSGTGMVIESIGTVSR